MCITIWLAEREDLIDTYPHNGDWCWLSFHDWLSSFNSSLKRKTMGVISKVEISVPSIYFVLNTETFLTQRDIFNSKTVDWTATWLAYNFQIKTSPLESLPQAPSLRWPLLFVPRTRPCPLHLPPHRPGLNSVGTPPVLCVVLDILCVTR